MKFEKFAGRVDGQGKIPVPSSYRKAICEYLGIDSLQGCILELKITVIHLKDNTQITFE